MSPSDFLSLSENYNDNCSLKLRVTNINSRRTCLLHIPLTEARDLARLLSDEYSINFRIFLF